MNSQKQQSSEALPQFMSIAQVQQELGVGRTTVYNMIYDGKLKAVKLGRYRRVTRSSFNEFVKGLYAQLEPDA